MVDHPYSQSHRKCEASLGYMRDSPQKPKPRDKTKCNSHVLNWRDIYLRQSTIENLQFLITW